MGTSDAAGEAALPSSQVRRANVRLPASIGLTSDVAK